MKKFRPSPALVISLIALFVALGGTSYAAINALPKNSVGTTQLKNGAVTATKMNAAVLKNYLHVGGTLPSGKTEVGDWGGGYEDGNGGGATNHAIFTFPVPLASPITSFHTKIVTGTSAASCPGIGQADAGYLCVYVLGNSEATTPLSSSVFNPELSDYTLGAGRYGFGIYLSALAPNNDWYIYGTYAVTAP